MKKLIILFLIAFLLLPVTQIPTSAEEIGIVYQIYDENDILLTEREDVETGDKFIDKNFNEFEVYLVDNTNLTAKAKYTKTYPKPNITKKSNLEQISAKPKKIAMYMTHNDESYILGDGTESVYGKGGIHDIAKLIKSELAKYNVTATLDETLHIPHNSTAYSRSNATAQRLLKDSPDAIFDIHRDGASRQYYLTKYNGKEHSKVRIVLGQSNSNSKKNLEFALYLMSVAEVECPWLFHDIYWGKGHYNQALSNKALLFEMGTHTIEKSYVEESAKELAKVINSTLYKTTIDESDNSLTIGGEQNNNSTLNNKLENNQINLLPVILIPSLIGVMAISFAVTTHYMKKKKPKK